MSKYSKAELSARRKRQAGFTLIEVIIATALGLLVLGALTSVVMTMMMADNTAGGRIEASSQVRNFQHTAYDDFVLARPPAPPGCGTPASRCTTQDLVLTGTRPPNPSDGQPVSYTVRYAWDPSLHVVTRYAGTSSRVAASNVTVYSWYIDRAGLYPTVVVNMTVTIPSYNATYSESQTLRFYPRITATPSP
jgi:prepilin-type N-terminal cleavage/methylation domain-containing protein